MAVESVLGQETPMQILQGQSLPATLRGLCGGRQDVEERQRPEWNEFILRHSLRVRCTKERFYSGAQMSLTFLGFLVSENFHSTAGELPVKEDESQAESLWRAGRVLTKETLFSLCFVTCRENTTE